MTRTTMISIAALRAGVLAATFPLFVSPALAQDVPGRQDDADSQLEEITVTATRREERLSKVPISIAAYTPEAMDRQGIRDVEDVARLTPGLSFTRNSFGSGVDTRISIRGISSGAGAATTAVYIDDVPIQIRTNQQTSFGSIFPKLFDLDRVEVLRGPQGTLFGAGAQGGALRFITPEPSFDSSSWHARTEINSVAHGGEGYEFGVAGGTPLIDDKLAVRASGWFQKEAGYVDRQPQNSAEPPAATLRDVNFRETTAFRGALAYKATESLTLTPSVYYQRISINDSGSFWGSLSDADAGRFKSGYAIRQPARDVFTLPSLKISVDLGAAELTSVSSYFDRDGKSTNDFTNLNIAFLSDGFNYPFIPDQKAPGAITARQKNLTQEVRLTSTNPDARLQWTVGAFYNRAKQDESFLIEDLFLPLYFPVEDVFGIPLTDGRYVFMAYNYSLEKQLAAFTQVDWRLSERVTATLGVRFSDTELEFERITRGPLNYQGSGPDFRSDKGTQSAKPITPKVGLNFQADEDNLFYVSAAKGFRIGGVNQPLFAGCTDLTIPTSFGPDSTWSYEFGSKNRLLGGKLRLEQSVFFIDWKDIQQSMEVGGACSGNEFRDNVGSASSRGFDLQASIAVTNSLTVSTSVGYAEVELSEDVVLQGALFSRKGDTIGGSPWQITAGIDYVFPLGGGQAYVHVDNRYGSRNNGSVARRDDPGAVGYDPELTADPAVSETNLRVGLRKGNADISLFVDNVLDKAPLLGKQHDVEGSPLFYYGTTHPRTIGMTITFRQ
ncbi:MAG: TonB-dependent receptor [Pseudomonadota bacterium]